VANNVSNTPDPVPGVQNLAAVGTFTGPTGNNRVQLPRNFTAIGGDTQLLGNFEYRIPLFGAVSIAAFADVGSAFNLRTGSDQIFSSNFVDATNFLPTVGAIPCRGGTATVTLNTLVACNSPLAISPFGGLVLRDNRLVTQDELTAAQRTGPLDPNTLLPVGFQQVFLRGEAQTNTVVRLSEGLFSRFNDFRSSIGAELRFQVPVINVPFRLIYAYNPNARGNQVIDGFPFNFNEKKSVFRFSVGRTF
jgi:outer membrane protein insertion porin family